MIRPEMLTNKWPLKPLGEVVDFLDHLRRPITAKNREPGPYPYYGANGKQDSVADYIFDEPLVLLAEDGGNFGNPERNIAYRVDGKCWVNNHAHVLKPKEMMDIDFLCRALEKYDVSKFINGATRAKLNKGIAATIPIPLPPLPEQHRIATILDKVDTIRRKRQQAIRLTEEFLRSVFLDMFGDPVMNPKGWEVKEMGALLEFLTSGSRGWAKYYSDQGRPFLRIQNIGKNRIQLDDLAYVEPPESAEARRTQVRAGDVLLSITADLGRTGVVPDNLGAAHINQHLALLRMDQGEPLYISAFLASAGGQRQFSKSDKGGVKAGLNFDDIRSLKVLFPPLPEQGKWVSFYKKKQAYVGTLGASLVEADNLFNSLVQRAFRGEL